MEVLYGLIALSFGLAFVGLAYFVWAVKTGQFEDLKGPAEQILFDDFHRED